MSARIHTRARRRQKPREGFLAHLLDPIDTLAEVIFSILILLTFTLAFRIFAMDSELLTADFIRELMWACLLYTSPSPRDRTRSRMPSSA